PDYWECLNNVLVFKGEEKPTEAGLNDAKWELISKMRAWNRYLYGDLKYILAYAAGGSYLQFYAIDPSFNLHIISDILDLCYLKDRVKALICIFNIHRIIRSMESLLPETAVPILTRFKRPYEVKAAISCVLNALVDLHELGYVHRDVQWPNILQLIDNSWMLIDLECAGIDDEIVDFGPSEDWAPEQGFISLSEKAYEFENATTAELGFRLTAQEALQHPWLSNS
ncbi:5382_t:CDS:2, partial [Gigaspora rosea]